MNTVLKTTPNHIRHDTKVFPALIAVAVRQFTPYSCHIRVSRSVCHLIVDGFYVPPDIQRRLLSLYDAYVDWWGEQGKSHTNQPITLTTRKRRSTYEETTFFNHPNHDSRG